MIIAVDTALLLQSGVVAAVVAGVVSVSTTWASGRRARLDRQRQVFAVAFEACTAYKEIPFIVRRRIRSDGDEKARITGELTEIQRRLSNSAALLQVEAPKVAERYVELVRQIRGTAGPEIGRSWELSPMPADGNQNIDDIDLSALAPYETAYLDEVRKHLRFFAG
jgi:hypothetical protein